MQARIITRLLLLVLARDWLPGTAPALEPTLRVSYEASGKLGIFFSFSFSFSFCFVFVFVFVFVFFLFRFPTGSTGGAVRGLISKEIKPKLYAPLRQGVSRPPHSPWGLQSGSTPSEATGGSDCPVHNRVLGS